MRDFSATLKKGEKNKKLVQGEAVVRGLAQVSENARFLRHLKRENKIKN